MGRQARANRAAFFKEQPYCIFCGGGTEASTKEHCPPRAMFQNKEWPEGFEFAACEQCNHGTGSDDVLTAFLARLDPIRNKGDSDGHLMGLFRNAHSQHPGFVQRMMDVGANEARRAAKELGIVRPKGATYREVGIVNVTDEMDRAVQTLACKLSKAVFFRETGKVFPAQGAIQFNWFTNADLFRFGPAPVLDAFASVHCIQPSIVRNKRSLSDQFDYRYSLSDDGDIALLQAVFGMGFGFVTIASPVQGKLNGIEAELVIKTGMAKGPFRFIQG